MSTYRSRIHYANSQRRQFIKLGAKRKELLWETAKVLNVSQVAVQEYFASMNVDFLEEGGKQ